MQHIDARAIRTDVLDRMERNARLGRYAILGAATVELLLLALMIVLVNWDDRVQVLIVLVAILTYTIIVLGLAALGAHVSRVGARVVAALDDRGAHA